MDADPMDAAHPKPLQREAHNSATAQHAAVKKVSLEINVELTGSSPAMDLASLAAFFDDRNASTEPR
jgi:hypothetical protein